MTSSAGPSPTSWIDRPRACGRFAGIGLTGSGACERREVLASALPSGRAAAADSRRSHAPDPAREIREARIRRFGRGAGSSRPGGAHVEDDAGAPASSSTLPGNNPGSRYVGCAGVWVSGHAIYWVFGCLGIRARDIWGVWVSGHAISREPGSLCGRVEDDAGAPASSSTRAPRRPRRSGATGPANAHSTDFPCGVWRMRGPRIHRAGASAAKHRPEDLAALACARPREANSGSMPTSARPRMISGRGRGAYASAAGSRGRGTTDRSTPSAR